VTAATVIAQVLYWVICRAIGHDFVHPKLTGTGQQECVTVGLGSRDHRRTKCAGGTSLIFNNDSA
jgi:hypothetical protein